jgi:hypothetical protein
MDARGPAQPVAIAANQRHEMRSRVQAFLARMTGKPEVTFPIADYT